jgi:hypothetical protein
VTWQQEWSVPRRARECAVTGTAFGPGDRVVSELLDLGDHFERRDRLEGAEAGPGEAVPFSRWASTWPPVPERAPGVDLELAARFLRDLLAEDDPERRPLAHVLALLLIRKRRLRAGERALAPDGTPLMRVSPTDDPDEILEIPAPPMTPEIVSSVSIQVAALFGFGPGPVTDEPDQTESEE